MIANCRLVDARHVGDIRVVAHNVSYVAAARHSARLRIRMAGSYTGERPPERHRLTSYTWAHLSFGLRTGG